MTEIQPSWFLLLLIAAAGLAVVAWWLALTRPASARRRWARVAQRRAPATARPRTEVEALLDHVARQLELLGAERHRLDLVRTKGEQLRRRCQTSRRYRDRVPLVERQLALLAGRAERLDDLMARYRSHRGDLKILAEGAAFNQMVEELEAAGGASNPLGDAAVWAEELDQQTQRLLASAEAEAELEAFLNA